MDLILPFFHPQAITLANQKSYPIFHFTEELRKIAPDCDWTIIGTPPSLLDCHVAEIYQKETYMFNRQVDRNQEYFKKEWRFQPTVQEWNILKSMLLKILQEGMPSWHTLPQIFGSKSFSNTPPWFYTEKGIDMAAFFQKTPTAKQHAIFIVEAFQQFKEQLAQTIQKKNSIAFLLEEQQLALEMARNYGLQGNQAILFANHLIHEKYKIDLLEIGGQSLLTSETQEPEYNATTLGKDLLDGISAQKVNKLLERAGLIRSYRDNKNRLKWDLTEEGKSYGVWKDTTKKHHSGTPVQQLFYKKSIVDILKAKNLIGSLF